MLEIIILAIIYAIALYVTYEKREHLVRMTTFRKIVYAAAFVLSPTMIIAWDLVNWLVYDE